MTVIGVTTPEETVDSDDEIAPTEPSTPDGRVPGGVAGYIVGECTVLCSACGREHESVHSHPEDTDTGEYDYDYVAVTSEWDYPGATCESCGRRLRTDILVYDRPDMQPDGYGPEA